MKCQIPFRILEARKRISLEVSIHFTSGNMNEIRMKENFLRFCLNEIIIILEIITTITVIYHKRLIYFILVHQILIE